MESTVRVATTLRPEACSIAQGDYFAINTPADKFAQLGMTTESLAHLSEQIGERLAGRAGGKRGVHGVDRDQIAQQPKGGIHVA